MGKSAPKADPRIGDAAMLSAQTGQQYLDWMQDLSKVTQGWATEDRARYQNTYQPIEDKFIADAMDYNSPERRQAAVGEAVADVRQQTAIQQQSRERNLAAMGVNPASGRFAAEDRRADAGASMAAAGASNIARRQVEATGDAKMAGVINMGKGLAVNPATSMGMTGQMGSSGFQGAMAGYGQQGSLLNTQFQQQMQSYNAQQSMYGGIGGALGSLLGIFMSSKDYKTEKRAPSISVLDAVRDMPVEEWTYKEGMGDGGGKRHIGPYAEDFAKATGLGDGKTISIIDAVGVSIGATQELADKVDRLEAAISGGAAPRRPTQTARGAPAARPRAQSKAREPISVRA